MSLVGIDEITSGEYGGGGVATPATIAWVSDGERAKPRRRRGRRRGRRSAGPPPQAAADPTAVAAPAPGTEQPAAPAERGPKPAAPESADPARAGKPGPKPKPKARPRRPPERLRTVHETSAGGLVIDGIYGPKEKQVAALIGRVDRRGRMLWSLPKGHIEVGETAEQTAIREVAEETGIRGDVLAALGSIDYWFVTEGRRVHKTVHHYLMEFSGGELSDEDLEVTEVAWVPLTELPHRLAYADERRLAEVADELIDKLQAHGPSALPPLPRSAPRRRPQTHSHARGHRRTKHAGAKKGGTDTVGRDHDRAHHVRAHHDRAHHDRNHAAGRDRHRDPGPRDRGHHERGQHDRDHHTNGSGQGP